MQNSEVETLLAKSGSLRNSARNPKSAAELMRAALDLFGQKEFADVTIKDIAEASGFDSGLIYYYFKDKRDLFNCAVKFALDDAQSVKGRLSDTDKDPVLAIRDWFAHCRQSAKQNRALFKVMIHYANSPIGAVDLDRRIQEFYANEVAALVSAMKRGVKLGLFKKVDVARLALFVSVQLDGITLASIMRPPFDVAAAIASLEQNLWKLLGCDETRPSKSAKPSVRRSRIVRVG